MVDARRDSTFLFPNDQAESVSSRLLSAVVDGNAWRRLAEDGVNALISIAVDTRDWTVGAWSARRETAESKSMAFVNSLTKANALRTLPYVLLFLLAFLPAAVLGVGFQGAFNSPDETARFLMAEQFAENRTLYIEDEITISDPNYATGPRAFAQHNGRSVPTYSQLPLLVFGIVTSIFGGAAPFVLAAIPGALFVTLALTVRRVLPSAPAYVPWAFLGVTPLWYWTSRVYFDVALTFLFIGVALLLLARAVQLRSDRHLFFGAAFFGMAALARIPEAPFLFILGFAFVLAIGHKRADNRRGYFRLTSIYGLSILAFFILPLMILNWWTNGSPTTVSYTLLFEQNFPERVQPAGNVLLEPFRLLWLGLFPQPLDVSTLYSTFVYQVLILSPFLLFLGGIGVVQHGGTVAKHFGGYGLAVIVIAFAYMLLSRNDPGTFLAGQTEPDLRVTLVRYWMPLFLLLGVGAVLAVARMPHRYALPLVVAFVVTSAHSVWYSGPEAISNLERTVSTKTERFAQFYEENTEPEALIVAGSSFDKWTVPSRRTIGIWPDTATEENLQHLADTGAAAVRRGQPVYYMFGPNEPENAAEIVSAQLEPQFLGLTLVAEPSFAGDLWKITSNPQALNLLESEGSSGGGSEPGFGPPGSGFGAPSEPGSGIAEFTTEFESPGRKFTITIGNDGSSRNLIANPSFEFDAELWRGPVEQGPVEISSEEAAYGNSSLRMELSPAPKAGERVRRTYSLALDDLASSNWNLRALVNVTELSDATVEMLVFVQDSDGKNLVKPKARVEEVTDGFVALVVEGGALPEGAAQLALQLSIVSTEEGGHGVAFWDGIELIDSAAIAVEYCDGDNFGCTWEGEPHASASSRSGGVESLLIESDGVAIEVDEPLFTGDAIVVNGGLVELVTADGETTELGSYTAIAAGDSVSVTLNAESKPLATVLGP